MTGDGTLGISVAAGSGVDLAGNLAPAAGLSPTFTVDNTPPSISFSQPSISLTSSGPVTYTVTYADLHFASSSLTAGSVSLDSTGTANGTVSVTGSGPSYTVTIRNITGDGFLGISIGGSTAVDLAGNVAVASAPSPTFAVVNHAPVVSISQPSAAYGTSYVNGITSVTYTVTYNSPAFSVSTLTAANITLNTTGGTDGTISVAAGSGSTRTVTISNITGNGTLGISVAAGTGTDQLGHVAGAAGPGPTFIVDNVAPTIAVAAPRQPMRRAGPSPTR